MSWFQRARNFLFPEQEQGKEEKQQQQQKSAYKRVKSQGREQQSQWGARGGASRSASTPQPKPPPGGRIVKQVIPAPEPVLIEAEALKDKRKAGVQGLLWYAQKQKQDADGDIANEFLEEAGVPVRLTPQQQVHSVPSLMVKRVVEGNVVLATKKAKC